MRSSPFDEAIAAMRSGVVGSLCGYTLTVNGVALAITDEQFEIAWNLMDELGEPDESVISLG